MESKVERRPSELKCGWAPPIYKAFGEELVVALALLLPAVAQEGGCRATCDRLPGGLGLLVLTVTAPSIPVVALGALPLQSAHENLWRG